MDLSGPFLDGKHTEEQVYFLKRLNRLTKLRSEQSDLNESGTRLIDRSIYSTYCDCVDLGVSGEAKYVLHRYETKHLVPANPYAQLPPPSA